MFLGSDMKELTIEITNNCANGCVHCSSRAFYEHNEPEVDEETRQYKKVYKLRKPEVIKVLEENPDFDKVRFSGGEPFMHPLILEFLREAKKRGKFVNVLTSGVFHWAEGIHPGLILASKPFVDSITLSLFGNEWNHAKVTGNSESYRCLDETVSQIIEARIPFSFNYVALQHYLDGLDEVFEYASRKRTDYCKPSIGILRFVRQGNASNRDYLSLSEEQIDRVKQIALKFSKKYDVEVGFGCSFAKTACRAGAEKRVYTYRGKYIGCSALKDSDGKRNISSNEFACAERW